jgi:glycosyltransferase involved in cell wall biosynthesis
MSSIRFDPKQRSGPMGHLQSPQSRAWRQSRQDTSVFSAGASLADESASRAFLSVVVPAKDEASGLPRLVEEIALALRPLRDEPVSTSPRRLAGFEIIIVDDGSTDATPLALWDLVGTYPELRPLRLRANVGQSAAIAAGLRAARGDWIATLDSDLQNDPADLVALWRALPGYDAALGWRVKRADIWSRRVISRLANRVRNAVLGQSIRDTGCSVRIFPRSVALRLPLFHGVHRFFGPLLLREGCRVVQVPVNHRPRSHGRSHYNFRNRSLRVIVDLLGVAWLMRRPVSYETIGPRGGEFVGLPRSSDERGRMIPAQAVGGRDLEELNDWEV